MLDSFTEYKEAAVIFGRTIEAPLPRTLPASKELKVVDMIPLIPFQFIENLQSTRSTEIGPRSLSWNLHRTFRQGSTQSNSCHLLIPATCKTNERSS